MYKLQALVDFSTYNRQGLQEASLLRCMKGKGYGEGRGPAYYLEAGSDMREKEGKGKEKTKGGGSSHFTSLHPGVFCIMGFGFVLKNKEERSGWLDFVKGRPSRRASLGVQRTRHIRGTCNHRSTHQAFHRHKTVQGANYIPSLASLLCLCAMLATSTKYTGHYPPRVHTPFRVLNPITRNS